MDEEEIKSDRKLKIIGRILLSWLFLYVCWALSYLIVIFINSWGADPFGAILQATIGVVNEVYGECSVNQWDVDDCGARYIWIDMWLTWFVISFPVSCFHLLIASTLSFFFQNKSFLFQSKVLQALLIALLMVAMALYGSSMQRSSLHLGDIP